MIARSSKETDKHVPVGVPFKRTCTTKTEVSESRYPDAENNIILWYFNERSKGLVPRYKPGQKLSGLLKRGSSSEVIELEFKDLFEYED